MVRLGVTREEGGNRISRLEDSTYFMRGGRPIDWSTQLQGCGFHSFGTKRDVGVGQEDSYLFHW